MGGKLNITEGKGQEYTQASDKCILGHFWKYRGAVTCAQINPASPDLHGAARMGFSHTVQHHCFSAERLREL